VEFFKLFELPADYLVDESALSAKYRSLQQKFHPDTAATASEAVKLSTLRQSALINDAYQTLRSPARRAAYLLHGHAIDALSEINTKMPLAFLQAQMSVRERLAEAEQAETVDLLILELEQEEQRLGEQFAKAYAGQDWHIASELTRQLQFVSKVKQDAHEVLDRF
jgi:molecular chaperone HscB